MAATTYASLVSLLNTIDHVMEHGRNSFALNHEQIQSVQEMAEILVEHYSHGDNGEFEALESRITEAAHEAEELIESKVVDYIHQNQTTSFDEMESSPICERLQEVIKGMDLLLREAMEFKEKKEVKVQLPKDSSSLPADEYKMVGFDDLLIQIMDRLTRQQKNRLVLPISGMGGIGKTTLTRNVYNNPYIVNHFDVHAWVTISQEYELNEILMNLLCEFGDLTKETSQETIELGNRLYMILLSRRYLIVMDDMWSIDVWDELSMYLPDNNNGSVVMITTRLTNMARHLGSFGLEVDFLDEDQSWNLLRQKVFGQQQECPLELEEIGKKIARNCKGLPLSIVVIAGILAKSNMTREYWDHVAEEVSSIVSQADDGQCLNLLSLSYVNLPVHLKPCFLYMGVFPENEEIKVSRLITLWIAEGLLEPNRAESLENVAEGYLMDLIGSNLITVYKQGSSGKIKTCKVHNLLRELCLREAIKENFIHVTRKTDSLHNQRRIVIHESKKEQKDSTHLNNQGELSVDPRSITFDTQLDSSSLLGCRLIRVLNGNQPGLLNIAFNLLNLRYFFETTWESSFEFPFTINLLWNLQTLILHSDEIHVLDIWKMKQLRYLNVGKISLPEPPSFVDAIDGGQDDSSLKHLHTVKTISDLILSEGVIKRISNIKKLHLVYSFMRGLDTKKKQCLSNLQHLNELVSLRIFLQGIYSKTSLLGKLRFPDSLKKLSLEGTRIPWEDMAIIGCLPNLEVLKLAYDAFTGREWSPDEGQFLSLKYLKIEACYKLEVWNAESMHFPNLEHLFISYMNLKEIPSDIGEIPTLRSIQLNRCSDSAVRSAIDILDEQENQGNAEIKVEVWLRKRDTKLKNLKASDNFMVHYE